jgi:hypothetical protein
MPGVVVTTATKSGPSASLRAPSSQVFMVGQAERGDTTKAIILNGMADVSTYLGDRPTYGSLYDQLKVYFDEGGTRAIVARVVGPAAAVGLLVLNDQNGVAAPTLRVEAQNPGAWSSRLKAQVLAGFAPNTFRIIITLDGQIVEDKTNMSTPTDAVNRFAQSPYVKVVNLASATAAPANNPAVVAATALSAGDDDRAAITGTHHTNALSRFTSDLGDGAVAIPGQTGAAVWTPLIDHCKANRRIALLASAVNETEANLKSAASTIDSEFAGLFAPWVVVSDGGYGTRNISPEGYVAACRTRAHEQEGPWRAPGGEIAKANTVLDVADVFSTDSANSLDGAKVNVIRKIAGTVRLYGWRSLSNDVSNYAYLKDRDFLNSLHVSAETVLEKYVFKTIDGKGQLLSDINSELVGLVDPYASAGALYPFYNAAGEPVDPGYKVETGSTVNTRQVLAANEVRARLSVRISPTSGLVSLNIVKVNVLAGL